MTELPTEVNACIDALNEAYKNVLQDNLRGVYVHGSIAMGCFNPESSDIDVLVVVEHSLSLETKKRLGEIHLKLAETCARPIELSVVLQAMLETFVYPTPFEFHFGNDHLEAFANGKIDLTTPRTDPDLAAHFVITKTYGITLEGERAQTAFPDVQDAYYLDSIARDAEWSYNNISAGSDEGQCWVPMYGVLNFCRVLAFIEEGLITSKRKGAEWGLSHCAPEFHSVIQQALNEYTETGSSNPVDCAVLKAFVRDAYNRIKQTQSE